MLYNSQLLSRNEPLRKRARFSNFSTKSATAVNVGPINVFFRADSLLLITVTDFRPRNINCMPHHIVRTLPHDTREAAKMALSSRKAHDKALTRRAACEMSPCDVELHVTESIIAKSLDSFKTPAKAYPSQKASCRWPHPTRGKQPWRSRAHSVTGLSSSCRRAVNTAPRWIQ